jgi:hypothetical protein
MDGTYNRCPQAVNCGGSVPHVAAIPVAAFFEIQALTLVRNNSGVLNGFV